MSTTTSSRDQKKSGYEKAGELAGHGLLAFGRFFFAWWFYSIPATLLIVLWIGHSAPYVIVLLMVVIAVYIYWGIRQRWFIKQHKIAKRHRIHREVRELVKEKDLPEHKPIYNKFADLIGFEITPRRGESLDNLERYVPHLLASYEVDAGVHQTLERVGHRVLQVMIENDPPPLVPMSAHELLSNTHPGDKFPIRISFTGMDWLTWDIDVASPHALVCGVTRSGKSVAVHFLMCQALAWGYQVIGIDPKTTDLRWARDVARIETEIEQQAEAVEWVREEMKRRYQQMNLEGVNSYFEVSNPDPPILLVIEEMGDLFDIPTINRSTSTEQQERVACQVRIKEAATNIARLGAQAKCHLLLAAQKPSADVVGSQLKAQVRSRTAVADIDLTSRDQIEMPREIGDVLTGKIQGRALTYTDKGWQLGQIPYLKAHDVHRVVHQLQASGVQPV